MVESMGKAQALYRAKYAKQLEAERARRDRQRDAASKQRDMSSRTTNNDEDGGKDR